MSRCARVLLVLVVWLVAAPAASLAQGTDSHWGIGGSLTPTWKSNETLRKPYIEGEGELEGKEFTIGIVRGSSRGGDWGVSFVHKPFKDGVSIVEAGEGESSSCNGGFCSINSTTITDTMQDVKLTGVEFHWFKPFGTIADRLQIGINLAGGVASVKGTVVETFVSESTLTNNGNVVLHEINTDTFDAPAGEVLRDIWGLGKVELQAAIIASPQFKIKISGGMNIPAAASFRVGAVILFGD